MKKIALLTVLAIVLFGCAGSGNNTETIIEAVSNENTAEPATEEEPVTSSHVIWHVEPSLAFSEVLPICSSYSMLSECVTGYPQEWENTGYTSNAISAFITKFEGVYDYDGIRKK